MMDVANTGRVWLAAKPSCGQWDAELQGWTVQCCVPMSCFPPKGPFKPMEIKIIASLLSHFFTILSNKASVVPLALSV